jgi:hypothetical protein
MEGWQTPNAIKAKIFLSPRDMEGSQTLIPKFFYHPETWKVHRPPLPKDQNIFYHPETWKVHRL